MPVAKLSSKNQIVIPAAARRALGLKPGDLVQFVLRGNRALVLKRPDDLVAALRGLGKGLYGRSYVKRERRAWD